MSRHDAITAARWAVINRHLNVTEQDPQAASLTLDEVIEIAVTAALDAAGVPR